VQVFQKVYEEEMLTVQEYQGYVTKKAQPFITLHGQHIAPL
jgi:hypothetical protein